MKKPFAIALLMLGFNCCFAFAIRTQSPLIAFEKRDGGQSNIWTMRTDGNARKRLTSDGNSHNPAWSPDGRKLAYVSNSQIWLMNSDGSDRRALTIDSKWSADSPSFSSDGKYIVFQIQTSQGVEEPSSRLGVRRLALANLNSQILHSEEVNAFTFGEPVLAPVGTAFYYFDEGGDYASSSLHRFDLKTKSSRRIYGLSWDKKEPPYYSPNNFALSPDGKRIAFQSIGWVNTKAPMRPTDTNRAGLVVMNSNGSGARLVLKDKAESSGLCWSSDGLRIIFANQYALQSLDLKTGKKTVLLRGAGLSSPAFRPLAKRK